MGKHVYLEDAINDRELQETDKKIVLLIGDSMRMGYCETVKNELVDIAEVVYPNDNCRFTQYVLTMLNAWAGLCDKEKVDLVQFNCGHWDAAHFGGEEFPLNSIEVYTQNIRRIIKRIRTTFPNAKVVFATSTPMNPNGTCSINYRTTEDIIRYNEAALSVVREMNVEVNDIFSFMQDWGSECFADYGHLTKEYFEILGKHVAGYIREKL